MDEELRAFLTERFGTIDQQFADLRREMDQRFEEQRRGNAERFAEQQRHFDVVAEGLRDEIRLLAEGHSMLREHMDRKFVEQEAEHRETRAMIKLSYAEVNRRITRLEMLVVDLEARLSRLEAEQ